MLKQIFKGVSALVLCTGLCLPATAESPVLLGAETSPMRASPSLQVPQRTLTFPHPVSFEGEVMKVESGQVTLVADNDMVVKVPAMALVWNGDHKVFAQDTDRGDRVVLHLRAGESYPVLDSDAEKVVLGGYDGVFVLPWDFVYDIDVSKLDSDIYIDYIEVDLNDNGRIEEEEVTLYRYDSDLKTVNDHDSRRR